jgi:hypothetical protein
MKAKPFLLTLFSSLILSAPLMAQGGTAARVAVEVVEQLGKKGVTTASREIVELGGEVAVRELIEQAEKEGGEQLVKALSEQAGKYGVVALQAAKGAPQVVVTAVSKLPQDLAESGLRAIAREPVAMQKLIAETGQEALEAAARHPGVGSQVAKSLGKEGAQTIAGLSDDAAVVLARHADDIAKLPATERAGVLAAFRTNTAKALKFIEQHPKTFLTIAGATAFIVAKDELLGINGQAGFLERMFAEPVRSVGYVVAGLLALWGSMKLFFAYRTLRRRSAK